MITIMRGDLEEEHIQLIKEEHVKQRYYTVARAEPIRITSCRNDWIKREAN